MRNRSITMPLLLIGAGVLFLINNARPDLSVWHLLIDWWPVLLIAFGAIRLLEVFALFGTGRASTNPVRPMGAGWIVLYVLIALAVVLPHKLNPHGTWGPVRFGVTDLFGEEFDFPVSVSTQAGSAKRLVLDRIRGGVTVTGGNDSEIQLNGHKLVHAFDRDAASKVNDQAQVTFTTEGDTIFVRTTEPANPGDARVSVDMEISVPKALSIEARGRSGDLTISSVEGAIDVSSLHGEVRLQDDGGDAKVDVEHCDLVRAANLKGALDLHGSGRDIQLENVDGLVTINGRFSGTLDFQTLAKPLHFESEQTDLRVEKLPGNISMSLSELRANNVIGPFKFVTHERDVHLEDFSGPVVIEIGHGDIQLKPSATQPLGRVDVQSRSGNIAMALPAGGTFDLKATAQQGEVTNDYGDGVVSESGQGRTNTLKSASASGPTIALTAERGEISVNKLE